MGKKESHRPKLRLVARKVPSLESVRVLVPKIGYDEQLDCFYADICAHAEPGMFRASIVYDTKTLPANFHTHELMDVDPASVKSLLFFQQKWGLVTSPSRYPLTNHTFEYGISERNLVTPLRDEYMTKEYEEMAVLLEALDERHPGFRDAIDHIGAPRFYPFAPRAEAEASITYLQDTVKKLVEAATEGYDEFGNIDYVNLRNLVGEIAGCIGPYSPPVEVLPQSPEFDSFGKSDTEAQSPIIPLSIATLAQLVGYLTSDSGYRVCPHCHKYFMFKRHAHDNYVRNRRSEYCSDSCQNAAKQKRYQARKGA